jgi:5-formyltetrahydrofolate cyclo-ligase
MLKAELRKIYLARQKSLSPEERNERSRQIADGFFQNFDLSKIRFLHCFLPIAKFNEIDTKQIFERIRREFPNTQTLVPRVDFQANEIENLRFTPETELIQNQWEIHEPSHDELVETEKIDLVLVPLLCFDRKGFRVGYGKGFYDRFLKNCRADCLKIGLSYFAPIAEISDAQAFDVNLDFCVTPDQVAVGSGSRQF